MESLYIKQENGIPFIGMNRSPTSHASATLDVDDLIALQRLFQTALLTDRYKKTLYFGSWGFCIEVDDEVYWIKVYIGGGGAPYLNIEFDREFIQELKRSTEKMLTRTHL